MFHFGQITKKFIIIVVVVIILLSLLSSSSLLLSSSPSSLFLFCNLSSSFGITKTPITYNALSDYP